MIAQIADAEVALALTYAPARIRGSVRTLFALDETLGGIVRSTREPTLGQMRLTWWHDALSRSSDGGTPGHPLLAELSSAIVGKHGVPPELLTRIVEGWELLLQPELTPVDLDAYADRGAALFEAAAQILGDDHPDVRAAGRVWALTDLTRHASDPDLALTVLRLAASQHLRRERWPTPLRMLGALATLAYRDATEDRLPLEPKATPKRMMLALRHRLTGRSPRP
jgi:15-cis-phytoene synthase